MTTYYPTPRGTPTRFDRSAFTRELAARNERARNARDARARCRDCTFITRCPRHRADTTS